MPRRCVYCVIDAGALLELLLGTMRAGSVRRAVDDRQLVAPAVIDAEILSALRGLERNSTVTTDRAAIAVEDLRVAPVERFALEPLLRRAWSLRDHLHAYDALYVALQHAEHVRRQGHPLRRGPLPEPAVQVGRHVTHLDGGHGGRR